MGPIIGIVVWAIWVLLGLLTVTVVGLFIYARWNYGQLEGLGFPVVKPHLFLGSNPNTHKEKPYLVDLERSKKYGPVYGVYDGRTPQIFISDPQILRIIQSRDFDHFRNHRVFAEGDHAIMTELLDFLNDEKWKTVRSALTPSFTSGKIKQMGETISEVSEEYVTALIKDNKGKDAIKMNFKDYVPPLVLEIIGKCFCGINIENARDPENKLIALLKTAMGGEGVEFDWTFTMITVLPFLVKLFPVMPSGALESFDQTLRGILKGREDSQIKKQDMVNTLLEMFQKARNDAKYKMLGISETTVISQGFEFFVASYQGTLITLSFLTYYLAINPDVQDRVLAEIAAAIERTEGRVTPDTVADLPFLTACLSETLRLAPSFYRLDRRCTKDWEYNGIKVKKGMAVIIPLWALHRNPEQFPEPETFDPDRFMPGRKEKIDNYAFNTFGQGPRSCIGQRFAYEMLKIIMVQYLKEFRIERRPNTKFKDIPGNPFLLHYEPILVDFVRRRV